MSETPKPDRSHRYLILLIAFATLAGCASSPPARPASLAEAEQAIRTAEKQDASRYATAELDEARQKLASAENAVTADDLVLAGRLGQQAQIAAELATARSEAAKAAAINAELARTTQALTEEMQRAGDRQ